MRRFRSGNRRLCVWVCVWEREREREGERQRERERRGRESDRESESQREGCKKEESLYLMAGGQRANTSPEASRRAKVTLSVLLSLCLSVSGPVSLSVSPCRRRTLLIRQIYTIWLKARVCCLSLCPVCQPFSTFNY